MAGQTAFDGHRAIVEDLPRSTATNAAELRPTRMQSMVSLFGNQARGPETGFAEIKTASTAPYTTSPRTGLERSRGTADACVCHRRAV
jgi:hypothetical protein